MPGRDSSDRRPHTPARHRLERSLVLIGFALGALYWIAESSLHVLVFDEPDFLEQLLSPGSHEAWMRLIVMLMFIAFGYYADRLLRAWRQAQQQVAMADLELSQVFETSADGMRIIDRDFNVIRANDSFASLVGLDKTQIIGQKCHAHFRGELCHSAGCPLRRILDQEQRLEYDAVKIRSDGNEVPCIVTATPFRAPDGQLIGIVEDFKDNSERQSWQQQLLDSHRRLAGLTAHLQVVREQERRRIAREIHDELGQSVTALNMDIHWLRRHLGTAGSEIGAKLDDMQSLVGETARNVHRISSELRPGILDDFGLSAAIEWQAAEFSKHTGIPCQVVSQPADIVLDDELSTAMFRILQESLTNIGKHARATQVSVTLHHANDRFEMRIQDNGQGLDHAGADREPHFGLIGMQERVRELGGDLDMESPASGGTTVHVAVSSASEPTTT